MFRCFGSYALFEERKKVKSKSRLKLKKARARKKLGIAISEGKSYNEIQKAARKAKIEPKVARQFQKALEEKS
jgi:hypothetical protein